MDRASPLGDARAMAVAATAPGHGPRRPWRGATAVSLAAALRRVGQGSSTPVESAA